MDNYKEVIKQLMKEQRHNYTTMAERMGITRAGVANSLSDCRKNMGIDVLSRYCEVLGAKIIIEWQDPMDKRRNFRWHIGGAK